MHDYMKWFESSHSSSSSSSFPRKKVPRTKLLQFYATTCTTSSNTSLERRKSWRQVGWLDGWWKVTNKKSQSQENMFTHLSYQSREFSRFTSSFFPRKIYYAWVGIYTDIAFYFFERKNGTTITIWWSWWWWCWYVGRFFF